MSWNQDFITAIEQYHEFATSSDMRQFAVAMGKNPMHAEGDCWVLEKFEKLKSQPLDLFLNLDRAHQALILRALDGKTNPAPDKRQYNYEHYIDDIGAYCHLYYTVETENYGEDRDGNRGELRYYVVIEYYTIVVNGLEITDYIDASEFCPTENTHLHEQILERHNGK